MPRSGCDSAQGCRVVNRWSDGDAADCATELELRAYSSRLIGKDSRLVLHGGGNTSVKGTYTDRFGDQHDAIWVKASGFDLGQMWVEGFTGLLLDPLLKLSQLDVLSDADMVNEVNRTRLVSDAASPSIEAIVHAVIPFKYVDHSHANAVLTLSNALNGREILADLYGPDVLVWPYVKPGFDLAKQFADAIAAGELETCSAIILEHHGVFTFSDDARSAYDRMIEIVQKAEDYLTTHYPAPVPSEQAKVTPLEIAAARKAVSQAFGRALLSLDAGAIDKAQVDAQLEMSQSGTLTPEHVIHNKPFPARISSDPERSVAAFSELYQAYFDEAQDPSLTMLPINPHWGLFECGAVRSFGPSLKKAQISRDVAEATTEALHYAGLIGGWQGLTRAQLRDLEYWELEQAKLKKQGPLPELSGKVAIVSGAAAGIGKACAETLRDAGAIVVGMDIAPAIRGHMNRDGYQSVLVDLTKEQDVKAAIADVVSEYGGLDMLVSNAGIFRTGDTFEQMDDPVWDATMAVNLNSHRKLVKHAIPYLRHGIDPSIVFVGSRNVHAPGAGAGAYSVSKAGLTQMARVLALELAKDGIRVNVVHPDSVFDTNLWTPEVLATSASRYGLTVEEYKSRNLMQTEVRSRDVGLAVTALLDETFLRTTGAQLSIDGGHERII